MKIHWVAVEGNTYPIKEQIKAIGGRWNSDRKVWMVPEVQAERVFLLLTAQQSPAPAHMRKVSASAGHKPGSNAE